MLLSAYMQIISPKIQCTALLVSKTGGASAPLAPPLSTPLSVDLIFSLSLSIHNCNAPKVGLALEHENTRNAGKQKLLHIFTVTIRGGNKFISSGGSRSFSHG